MLKLLALLSLTGLSWTIAKADTSLHDTEGSLESLNCSNPEGTLQRSEYPLVGGNVVLWKKKGDTITVANEEMQSVRGERIVSDNGYRIKTFAATFKLFHDSDITEDDFICRAVILLPIR